MSDAQGSEAMDAMDMEVEVPSSSTTKGDKKRFEVKKVCTELRIADCTRASADDHTRVS